MAWKMLSIDISVLNDGMDYCFVDCIGWNSYYCGYVEFLKMNERNKEYDVVVDVLQKHREKLWMMTNLNMNADSFNIMDQIRLEQIDRLDKAIIMWLNSISESKK